jgi:cardiolipin synthase
VEQKTMKWLERNKHGTDTVRVPFIVFASLIFLVIMLTLFLWSVWRGSRDTHLQVKNPGELQVLLPSIVGLTQATLDGGNQIQLTENGDGFFPPLLADIAAARESVHVESYIWQTGKICDDTAALLAKKAREGVEVRLMVDASGGHKMDDKLKELMEKAGVKLARFHPIRISNIGRLNNRDHRKIAVIDGRIGYIGGYGFADTWTGHAQDKQHYRDSGLRVMGPIVNRLQAAFCENWIEETGEIPAGDRYFPKPQPAGTIQAHLAYTSPTGSISSVQVLYYLAISAARHEIIIQNPYLLPDGDAMQALRDAVKRGVDVKVMVPATDSTDSPIVQHASHHHFGNLLNAGVKIWEYDRTLLHQKVLVVDGVWSCVGSTNFDDRSFDLNDEISMGVLDPGIAGQLRAAFTDDLRHAHQRHIEEWRDRGLWHKMIDGVAYLGHAQL